jgi:manganese/zinc/iron transport system permease protein
METVWTLIVASLAAINCSLIGTYLVLRRLAMMGDAIAHAVLPGIVIAFLLAGSKNSLVVLIGAGSVGLLATLLIEFLHSKTAAGCFYWHQLHLAICTRYYSHFLF